MVIETGMEFTCEAMVDETNVAGRVGSGLVDVFATPMMVALMEQAAAGCIQPALQAGQTTVGTAIAVQHTAATPVGMRVSATAKVTAVEGNGVSFEVCAADEKGPVGHGTHTRYIVDEKRFRERAYAKLDV